MANRYPVETESLIGFFMSTLALRLPIQPGASFRQLQAEAHQVAVNGFAHPDLPFDQVVAELQGDPAALASPVFQTLFVLQNIPSQAFELPGLVTTKVELARPSAGATFDLTLSLKVTDGELGGALEYHADLFEPATIERLAAQFQALLIQIVQAPDQAVAGLPG